MATREIVREEDKFGLCVLKSTGEVDGWLLGPDGVLLFESEKAARRSLDSMRKNDRYSWSLPVEPRVYREKEVLYGR